MGKKMSIPEYPPRLGSGEWAKAVIDNVSCSGVTITREGDIAVVQLHFNSVSLIMPGDTNIREVLEETGKLLKRRLK